MTPRCAIAVMREYGTLADLLDAYMTTQDGKLLLADLTVFNANGSQSRFGPKLSGVVHLALITTNPSQKLK